MSYVITPYVIISACAAGLAVAVAILAWQRRTVPGGSPLVALMIAVGIWSAGAAVEYAIVGIPGKVLWAKLQYVGVVAVPVFYLLLAIEYSQHVRWLTRRRVVLLFVAPLITLLLTVTNDWHGLIWPTITPIGSPAANLALYSHGLGFWLGSAGYGYLLLALATGLLIRAAYRFPAIYRRQAITLVLAALAPWLVNLVYVLGLSPAPGLEATPLVLVVTGGVVAWSLLRQHLLDLVPVARETLIETMAEGMVVLDLLDRVVDINPAAQRFIGAPTPILVGQPARTAFAGWQDWAARLENVRDARLEFPANDPARRTFELNVSPIYDRRGEYSGRLITIQDITVRKAAQREIELLNDELEARVVERTRALAASQERFRQVITSIADVVFALQVKSDGTITTVYSSPRLIELTGFPQEALQGGFFNNIALFVHPEDQGAVTAYFQAALATGAGEIEYRLVRADGILVWVRTSARVQHQGYDRIIFGVTSDITARKQMETISAEVRALAELDKLRTALVSNVSHELRTPLGLIKVASTTLLRQDVSFPPAVQQQILRSITEEADRLEQLVSNLLDISRFDQQRFFLQREWTDLNQLLTTMVDAALQQLAGDAAAHRIRLELPAQPVVAQVDAPKLEQVVRNLIQNAINYSPVGSAITVALCGNPAGCELRVSDEGFGIAREDQSHIFERFFRARDARVQRIRGTGLGLAICREIVEAHGGTICVESELNRGATFIVRLPQSESMVRWPEDSATNHTFAEPRP